MSAVPEDEDLFEQAQPAGALAMYLAAPPRVREAARQHLSRIEGRELAEQMLASKTSTGSWEPQPLDDILDGTLTQEVAELLPRSDGHGLIYQGKVHSFHGESESGKSFLLQAETARILNTGGRVLFLDFESDRVSVVKRLMFLGADKEQIRSGLAYIQPEEPLGSEAWKRLLAESWALVVIDGVTDAMNALGFTREGDVNDQATRFINQFPDRIANETGAAVVLIDHVTKGNDGRGRFAIGAQAKLSGLSGAAYTIEVVSPLMPGRVGELVLRVGKDRPAGVRQYCSPKFRASDRTQEAARIEVDSTRKITKVTIKPPADLDPNAEPFRPTTLMQRISDHMEIVGGKPLSANQIVKDVIGNRKSLLFAIQCLVEDGFVTQSDGPRGPQFTLTMPYVEGFALPDQEPTGSWFPPKGGEPEEPLSPAIQLVPGTSEEPVGTSGICGENERNQ